MAFIVTGLCLRHEACVDVCPVDCIVVGQPLMEWPYAYIDPAKCIDCGLCVPACPYNAIFPEEDVPDELKEDIPGNVRFFVQGPGYSVQR